MIELNEHKITVFNAKKNYSKMPLSPFGDNTFVFETHTSTNNLQLYSVLVSHWILNIPLAKIESPIRTFRRKENLQNYYGDKCTYFILDIDDVKTPQSETIILEYFKKYKVIIGESKSYDGITNFNMKGILFIDPVDIDKAKQCISGINHELKDICTIDEAVSRRATLNAPIGKNKVLLNNESGPNFVCAMKSQTDNSNEMVKEYTDITNSGEKVKVDIASDIEATTIEELCIKIFKNMGFEAIRHNDNESITFKHPSEEKTKGGYFWFSTSPYTMHHANSTKTLNIFDAVRKTELGKELMTKTIDYNDAFLNFDTNTTVISTNEQYLKVEGKEEIIQEFLTKKDGLFSIKSPMGTAKSTLIKYIVEQSHDLDMKVLIITNRRSVASDFAKKYSMKLYSKDKYNIGDSLIVQYDSLWKYNIKDFDIVVMDEFISLMMHSRSNLNNSSINIAKFFGAFNKKLVIADAFLTGYENFLLNNKKDNIVQLDNTWRDKTILHSYNDQNYFVQELLYQSKTHKLTVSSTSLNFLNSLRLILEKRGLTVITLTAETPDSTKELIYDLFEKEDHDKWDVFLYSPTLTVGVSNLNNIPYHFHFDSSRSTDVISSIQMMKRTRKAKEIHMYIGEKVSYLKTTYNAVRDEYMGNMGRNIDHNYLFDIDDYGEAKLSKTGRNAVKIDTFKNILEFNHKQGMLWMLKYHFFHEPRIIENKLEGSILSGPSKQLKATKDLALTSNINEFLHLSEIEKTDLLMGEDASKVMRTLAEIDDFIKEDTNNQIRTQILNITLKNKQFIKQCRYYRDGIQFSSKFIELSDIKSRVSHAVITNNSDDLNFYNALIYRGQTSIKQEYLKLKIENKTLKFLLDKMGYKDQMGEAGTRVYKVLPEIKDLYGYIK